MCDKSILCMHLFTKYVCVWGEGIQGCVCVYMFVCTVAKPQAKFTWILLILLTFLNFSEKKREKR